MTISNSKYKLLIFDWDGTLMDSLSHIVDCTHRVAELFAFAKPTLEQIRSAIGLPTRGYIKQVFPASKYIYEELCNCYINHYAHSNVKESLFKGVEQVLAALSSQGYQMAIATNKSHKNLQQALELHGLDGFFMTLRCGDDVFTKPQPEVIWGILKELQFTHAEALMIGDTEFDMQVAVNAGIDAVAVGYGVRDKKQLLTYSPIGCIEDIKELELLLAK